jgi:hypothetical protein
VLSRIRGLFRTLQASSTEIRIIGKSTTTLVFTIDSRLPALVVIYTVLHHTTNTDGTVNVSGIQTVRGSGGNRTIIGKWEGSRSSDRLFLLGLGLRLGPRDLGGLHRSIDSNTTELTEQGKLFRSGFTEGSQNSVDRELHLGRRRGWEKERGGGGKSSSGGRDRANSVASAGNNRGGVDGSVNNGGEGLCGLLGGHLGSGHLEICES